MADLFTLLCAAFMVGFGAAYLIITNMVGAILFNELPPFRVQVWGGLLVLGGAGLVIGGLS